MELPKGNIRWIEVWWWYDWIAYYEDKDTWQKYSKVAHVPIDKDELCKYWYIYKVRHNWEDKSNFDFEVLSRRPDWDEWGGNS